MTWSHDSQKEDKWTSFVQALAPEIDPQAISLMDELRFVGRAIYHVSDHSLNDAGLSFAQYKVLMHLFFAEQMCAESELNPSQISERQGVSRNAMSSLIRNLEDEALVERRLDPLDRRRFNISLTDNGRSLVTNYAREHLALVNSCFSALTTEEQQELSDLLRKVRLQVEAVRVLI
ncbi:MAG: MarR family winged helix-turn-helix transcriptional regulator [Chloroflexota bacterium]|jgi:MarR family 2-MHQ and catechol resistance regulon transcriptional repressor